MVEKLKSVLKIPKLRLGAKAVALALSLYFLPVWTSLVLSSLFYFLPVAFSFSFLGTFISFLVIVGSFFSALPTLPIVVSVFLAATLFYFLLGIKNVLFLRRSLIFFALFMEMVFFSFWEFFAGIISLPVLALVIFLLSRDALASFTPSVPPAGGRIALLSAVLSLLAIQISWAVFYLSISSVWATIAVFMGFSGALYAIIKYLRGELFSSNAPFRAVALAIFSFVLLLLLAF
jgi:hypothetical protein